MNSFVMHRFKLRALCTSSFHPPFAPSPSTSGMGKRVRNECQVVNAICERAFSLPNIHHIIT